MHDLSNHSLHGARPKTARTHLVPKHDNKEVESRESERLRFRLDAPLPLPDRPLGETVFPYDCHCRVQAIARPESVDYPPIIEVPPKRVSR